MEMTLKEIAEKVGGEIIGEPTTVIKRIGKLENAEAGTIVWIGRKALIKQAEEGPVAAVICDRSVESSRKPLLRVDNPKLAFARLSQLFFPPRKFAPGVSPDATVSPKAKIGKDVTIQPQAVIEDGVEIGDRTVVGAGVFIGLNSKIGSETRLFPNATINEDVVVGDRCLIHSGAVLGGDGFGYVRDEKGLQVKIPQVGGVVLEDDVEIGCNVTIDRATFGDTIVRKGAKIDNLVQIAHNDDIGENTAISALCGIAGSSKIGKNVILGGQVGISDHAEVGDNVILAGKSGIASRKKVKPNQVLLGAPARPLSEAKKLFALQSRLIKQMEEKSKNPKSE